MTVRKLDRTSVSKPACLVTPPALYADLYGPQKEEIRSLLLTMQGDRCAYCERRTGAEKNDGHIEHFRDQSEHNSLQLDWANMFWSCNDEKTCGKHKDKCKKPSGPLRRYDPDDVINPGSEDPEGFFLFVSDGTVRPRDGLAQHELHRVAETLRVFQLADSAFLRKSREDAVKPYVGAIDWLISVGPEHVSEYILKELGNLAAPFSTAIKHFLESQI